MKKFLTSILVILTVLSTMCVFATEEVTDEGQVIEIDDYEEYEELFGDEEQISDEEYEELYEEQMEYLTEYYDEIEMPELIKARVIKAGEPEYIYESDYTGFIYKMKKQDVMVEILDGEHAGKHVAVEYPLMADTFLNLEIASVKNGDVIYVDADIDDETEELYAEAGSVGFNVERKTGMIILAIVAVILVCAFGKDRGILSALIAVLIVSITLLICSEQIYLGTSIILLTLVLATILISLIAIQKLGLTKDALWVAISSLIVIIVTTFVTFGIDYMVKNTGATFDTMSMVENIIKRNIDFHHMFIGSIILILSAILPYVACNVWNKCKELGENDFNKLLDASKDAITGKIEMVTIILMTLLMPKLIYLYSYKYTMNEIMNSDIMVTEFVRLFMCIIAIALTVPVTSCIYKLIEAKENNVEENK